VPARLHGDSMVPLSQIAATVGITRRFVYKWAQRFLQEGLEGLADKPGRGGGRWPHQPDRTWAISMTGAWDDVPWHTTNTPSLTIPSHREKLHNHTLRHHSSSACHHPRPSPGFPLFLGKTLLLNIVTIDICRAWAFCTPIEHCAFFPPLSCAYADTRAYRR